MDTFQCDITAVFPCQSFVTTTDFSDKFLSCNYNRVAQIEDDEFVTLIKGDPNNQSPDYLDQRIIFLVQIFDGLQGFFVKDSFVDTNTFDMWEKNVMEYAQENATELEINDDLRVANRFLNLIDKFNENSLKNRFSQFWDDYFMNDKEIENLGEKRRC